MVDGVALLHLTHADMAQMLPGKVGTAHEYQPYSESNSVVTA